jgi:hypothetical protein
MLLPAVFIIALCGVATSSASAIEAPFYKLEGVRLKAKETREVGGKAVGNLVLKSTGAGITITCTGSVPVNGLIIGSETNEPGTTSGKAEFTGCTVAGNGAGCAVPGKTIVTNALTGELVLGAEKPVKGTKIQGLVKPTTGSVFVVIKFEGAECKFKETTIEGSADGELLDSTKKTVAFEENEKEEVVGFGKPLPNGTKECKFAKGELVKCTTSSLKAFGVATTSEGTGEGFLIGADKGKKAGVFSK